METLFGVESRVGSSQEVRDGIFAMIDGTSGHRSERPVEGDARQVPHPVFQPRIQQTYQVVAKGDPGRIVSADARICNRDECSTDATAVAYSIGGVDHVFTEEYGIPLRVMDVVVSKLVFN